MNKLKIGNLVRIKDDALTTFSGILGKILRIADYNPADSDYPYVIGYKGGWEIFGDDELEVIINNCPEYLKR